MIDRRRLVTGLVVGAAALARPAWAYEHRGRWHDDWPGWRYWYEFPPGGRRRILPDDDSPDAPGTRASGAWSRLAERVEAGDARWHGGLLVLFLRGPARPAPEPVRLLDEARRRREIVITEDKARPAVRVLEVDNRGDQSVLLLAGEILAGGRQDRIVADDVLLPARSGPRRIGVYCVESDRWSGRPGAGFEPSAHFAAPGLRRVVANEGSQDDVWHQVASSLAALGIGRTRGSYAAVASSADVALAAGAVEQALGRSVPSESVGFAALARGHVVSLDLFEDSQLFTAAWSKLVRALALEARRARSEPHHVASAERDAREDVRRLLRVAASVTGRFRRTPGEGALFAFRADHWRGTTLVVRDHVVHAAIV